MASWTDGLFSDSDDDSPASRKRGRPLTLASSILLQAKEVDAVHDEGNHNQGESNIGKAILYLRNIGSGTVRIISELVSSPLRNLAQSRSTYFQSLINLVMKPRCGSHVVEARL